MEIKIWHKIRFDMIHSLIEGLYELEEILLVKENFMLLVAEIIPISTALTLCDSQIVVVASGRFDVKKISAFSGFYLFREYFISIVSSMLFHCAFWFGLMIYRILR